MLSGIYTITAPSKGIYVGSAVNITRRWRQHCAALKRNGHHNKSLQRAYKKYGLESFTFEILEEVSDINKLITREQYWIDMLKLTHRLYNTCLVAGSTLGRKPHLLSEESRRKISDALRGRKHTPEQIEKSASKIRGRKYGPMPETTRQKISARHKGRIISEKQREIMRWNARNRGPISDETRAKLAKASTGRPVKDETRAKISAANSGRIYTLEQRQRMSERHRGRVTSQSTREKLRQINTGKKQAPRKLDVCDADALMRSGGKRYTIIAPDGTTYTGVINAAAFAKKHNLRGNLLRMVLRGTRPHTMGWTGYVEP